ncbi:MAG TPA: hypothetical protein VK815_07095 [Candidatus Acidoferrales bacterium]|jgi:hypothetical protein|nr:hypothetical protein [Candidatus Acidoferrales bacterium]
MKTGTGVRPWVQKSDASGVRLVKRRKRRAPNALAFGHIRRYSVKFADIRPFREKIILCEVLAYGDLAVGHPPSSDFGATGQVPDGRSGAWKMTND